MVFDDSRSAPCRWNFSSPNVTWKTPLQTVES